MPREDQMTHNGSQDIIKVLNDWRSGDQRGYKKVDAIVYQTLYKIAEKQMRKEKENHTIQTTVLVNHAYMQLINCETEWVDSTHFQALSAGIMRRTLIDHARYKKAQKRGGDLEHTTLMGCEVDNTNVYENIELSKVLEKLAKFDERKARIIKQTFFDGMSYSEIAKALNISKATVERELRAAKDWLRKALIH